MRVLGYVGKAQPRLWVPRTNKKSLFAGGGTRLNTTRPLEDGGTQKRLPDMVQGGKRRFSCFGRGGGIAEFQEWGSLNIHQTVSDGNSRS